MELVQLRYHGWVLRYHNDNSLITPRPFSLMCIHGAGEKVYTLFCLLVHHG